MEMQQKQNIESLAVISRNVEKTSKNARSDIQAITTPVHRMNSRFDFLLQKAEDIKTTLSNIQLRAGQNHDITLDICHNISEQCHQILQNDRASPRSLQDTLCTSVVELGAEQQLPGRKIATSSNEPEDQAEEMTARMNALVRLVSF